jgi:hypothetical protein
MSLICGELRMDTALLWIITWVLYVRRHILVTCEVLCSPFSKTLVCLLSDVTNRLKKKCRFSLEVEAFELRLVLRHSTDEDGVFLPHTADCPRSEDC